MAMNRIASARMGGMFRLSSEPPGEEFWTPAVVVSGVNDDTGAEADAVDDCPGDAGVIIVSGDEPAGACVVVLRPDGARLAVLCEPVRPV